MSVLVEAHSIIVRCDAVRERHAGGWDQFLADIPNRTFCSDGEIARVGFMAPSDAEGYIRHLASCGLIFCENGRAVDIAAAFQQTGLTVPCDWLEFGRVQLEISGMSGALSCCRLLGGERLDVATPARWNFQGSLSQTLGIFPSAADSGMNFLRHENGVDVYYDNFSEKEVFVGRTGE